MSKVRKFVRVSRVSPDIEIVPFNHKFSTLERAVKERVFRVKGPNGFVPPPRPSAGVFCETLGKFRSCLKSYLPSTAPFSFDEFVGRMKGRKKEIYSRALEELRSGLHTPEEDASVEVFIKCEKTDRTSKTDPVPRVISPRNPRFNLRVGRYLSKIEHRVFKSIGRLFDHPTVVKGFTYDKTAELLQQKWDMFAKPVAIGLDASRFDQHVSMDALKFEHSIYTDCFYAKKDRAKLAALLKHQLVNRCVGHAPDGVLKYTVEGTRMSGDMNTSLGNCVLMCGMIWEYARQRNVRISLANNGDDCVVFMDESDLVKFSHGLFDWFLSLGFNMAIEKPVFEFEHIEFCQTKPVFDGERYTMCRNPFVAIAKDSVMLNPWQGEKLFKGWLDAVGVGGLSLAGGLPVFQSFYSLFVRSGKRYAIPERLLSWSTQFAGGRRSSAPVMPEARASFYEAFGITPDEQICLEDYYDGMVIGSVLGEYAPRGVFP